MKNEPKPNEADLLTTQDLCYLFKRKPLTIYQWRMYKDLPYIKVRDHGRHTVRFEKQRVFAWAKQHKKRLYLGGGVNETLIERDIGPATARSDSVGDDNSTPQLHGRGASDKAAFAFRSWRVRRPVRQRLDPVSTHRPVVRLRLPAVDENRDCVESKPGRVRL